MATFDALEALLQFREGGASATSKPKTKRLSPIPPPALMPQVPNPLDPTQPHLIEGDAPTPNARRQGAFGSGLTSAFSPKHSTASSAVVSSVLSVPNPLTTPAVSDSNSMKQPAAAVPLMVTSMKVPSSTQHKAVTHGFGMHTAPATHKANAEAAEVRNEKIRDALNSKPQRGKKRQNLSDLERQELTRTRNREHARSTRMKKKQKLQQLQEMEQKYIFLKEKEALELRRQEHLVEFIESAGNTAAKQVCSHSSGLIKLASQEILKPEFSVDTVALAENSGMVKVSVHGTDLESEKPKTMSGVISIDFAQGTTDVNGVSLYWSSSPKNSPSRGGIIPSVSVLSFES